MLIFFLNINFISGNCHTVGGGIGIFLCNTLYYTVHDDLNRMLPYIECLFIEIPQTGKQNMYNRMHVPTL